MLLIRQPRHHRIHRLRGAGWIALAREHAPGLRDRIDPAFLARVRTERGTIVIGATTIVPAIPARRFERLFQAFEMAGPALGAGLVTAFLGNWQEAAQRGGEEPAEPDARALALDPDAIHPVVPVAAEDQRQAVLPGALDREIERAGAVLIEAGLGLGRFRLEEAVMLAGLEGRALDEGDLLVEDGAIAADRAVMRGRMAKPDHIVGDQRANAGAGVGQPPMQHVALRELPCGSVEDLRTRQLRPVQDEGQRILQLVAEAEGAAGLVERRSGRESGTRGSDRVASVDEVVEGFVRCLDLDDAGKGVPVASILVQHGRERNAARGFEMLDRLGTAVTIAHIEQNFTAFAWLQRHVEREGGAGVAIHIRSAGERRALQDGLRCIDAPVLPRNSRLLPVWLVGVSLSAR